MRRNIGSLPNGLTWTRCLLCTLTTAGIARSSIGAKLGIGWPPLVVAGNTADGRLAGVAVAGWLRLSRRAVAANPPKPAAAANTNNVGSGRRRRAAAGRSFIAVTIAVQGWRLREADYCGNR